MQMIIHSNDFSLTGSLDSFIRTHASKTMGVCSEQVEKLIVRLKDVNGPKGGDDKECCVEVQLANFAPIIVRKRSSDAYSSIRKALGRASRTTLRKVSKRRSAKVSQVPINNITSTDDSSENSDVRLNDFRV